MSGYPMDVRALLPHDGTMVLLERVDDWDKRHIRCTATSHRAPTNPLRDKDRLPAIAGIEYAAQAIAAHGALVEGAAADRASMGLLAGVRNVRLYADRLDGPFPALTICATKMLGERQRAIYSFTIESESGRLLEGRATVVIVPSKGIG
jgi:predicted hotdog family 3-hydroxylacyl-ACP dehydratase